VAFRDGDGWVMCSCGHRHWGLHGAAGLLLVRTDLDEPRGALDSHEDSVSAAAREAEEEAGISASSISVRDVFSDDHGPWRYDTVIAHTDSDAGAHAANAESDDLRWVLLGEVAGYQLHKGLEGAWPELLPRILATLST
jgi:8-oxo-dGTP diphosphatase